ncbi:MAG: Dabb family protein [Helicobacteraceae bacterium]|nr:Dabb family protein [Helicobacteraceae bacterium]
MIVHIVMFQFKEENKERNIAMVKERLEALVDLIPELEKMEVGVNFNDSERAFDLSIYSTFTSQEDLDAYAVHPEHMKVVALIKELTETSKVVDYIL